MPPAPPLLLLRRVPEAEAMAAALRVLALQRRLREGAGSAATVMGGAGARSGALLLGAATASMERLGPGTVLGDPEAQYPLRLPQPRASPALQIAHILDALGLC